MAAAGDVPGRVMTVDHDASPHYDVMMRTTLDLPDNVHALVRELAHQQGKSMGTVIAELIMASQVSTRPAAEATGARGFPVISVGHPVTAEDVASLEDE